jgi:hypothetical protein
VLHTEGQEGRVLPASTALHVAFELRLTPLLSVLDYDHS